MAPGDLVESKTLVRLSGRQGSKLENYKNFEGYGTVIEVHMGFKEEFCRVLIESGILITVKAMSLVRIQNEN